ncbi:MAG: TolC family protein [Capnocytophaga sp.]|nr:TolC family protein [Capnocytophaga sp.]
MPNYLILFLCFSAYGQTDFWDVERCISVGLQNSYDLQIKQLETVRAEKARTSRISTLLPNVRLYGSQTYDFGSTINPASNTRVSQNIQYDNFNAQATMNLLDFSSFALAGKSVLDVERSQISRKAAEYQYQLLVMEAFYQAFFAQELLKIQRSQMENADYNLDRIRREVSLGSKPQSDLYDMQLSHSQEQIRLTETAQRKEILLTELFQLLVVKVTDIEDIELQTDIFSENNGNFVYNPKLHLAELDYEYALQEVRVQRAQLLPNLQGFYRWSTFYYKPLNSPQIQVNDFGTQISDNRNQQFGVQLNIPVFNGFRIRKQINAAKISAGIQKTQLEAERQKLTNETDLIRQKITQLAILQNELDTAKNYAQASFRTAQAKFEHGKIEAVVFSSVKNQWLSAQYNALKNDIERQYALRKRTVLEGNNFR